MQKPNRRRTANSPGRWACASGKPSRSILLTLDLWLIGFVFNPRVDPDLLTFRPPAVEWLEQRQDPDQPWRFTTFQHPDEQKTYNANLGMLDWLQDVRGYDSIISKQYADYMSQLQTQGDLLYNRIAPIYAPNFAALDDPLFDLLGIRYVMTTQDIPNESYRLVYDNEVRIYENLDAMPRAIIVPEAVGASETNRLGSDTPVGSATDGSCCRPTRKLPEPVYGERRETKVREYGLNDVLVEVDIDAPGWLILTDAYFAGWRAYVRPLDVVDEGTATHPGIRSADLSGQRQLPGGLPFRAGLAAVRFHYTPMSFKIGLYTSFLALMLLFLLVGWWAVGTLLSRIRG